MNPERTVDANDILLVLASLIADTVVEKLAARASDTPESTRLMLTAEQAGQRLGIGRTNVYSLLKAGELESVLIGTLRRIPVTALEEYVHRLRQDAT